MSTEKGRYSRVSRRVWNDDRFRGLSHPKPCSGWLFFRLLTGPELTCIPGLFQAWEAGLAQALGWSVKDFRKAFKEIESQKLAKADWKTGLVWLPNGIKHNEPENPNIVASAGWRADWAELPDCALKFEAQDALFEWAASKGPAWVAAFSKIVGNVPTNHPPNVRGNVTPNHGGNQKQDQDQEQEQRPPNPPPKFAMHPGWQPSPDVMASFDVAMIPRWGSVALVALHRSFFCSKKDDVRTDQEWNESCSKWVIRDWNNPGKRPKQPPQDRDFEGDADSVLADLDRRQARAQ